MILHGLMDSPFARRVAVAFQHWGVPYERRALSVFGDFDEMLKANPLGRAPSVTLDDGRVLADSRAIIELFDAEAPEALRLTPADRDEKLDVLQFEGVAIGIAEKSVERNGETKRRPEPLRDPAAVTRLERQIEAGLGWMEALAPARLIAREGDRLTRADLASACGLAHLAASSPDLFDPAAYPRLAAHAALCESLPPFRAAPFGAY